MRPFGLAFAIIFLVSAFAESSLVDCRVLLGSPSGKNDQSRSYGVGFRRKNLSGVAARSEKKSRGLASSAAGERMHTMASGPSRRGAGH
ncbi:PREDICTED: uncharacterized protein LOC109116905 [Tarenaya hassleriana]|uniref:uncharacterized protein LOC109116905 n=1 Tax=Tarenaya hassleriana TaxID=28532 RepID=UPI0008FD16C6|nr:PREDICTED: uncharacterized protein LOC109116905 [Tarenaya hassleriana]